MEEERFITVMITGKNERPSLVKVEANMAGMEGLLNTPYIKVNTINNSLGDELYLISPMDHEVKSLKNITDWPYTCAIARADSHFLFSSLTIGDIGELSRKIFEDVQGLRPEKENVISFYLTRDYNNKLRFLADQNGLTISKLISGVIEGLDENTSLPFAEDVYVEFTPFSKVGELTQLSALLAPKAYLLQERLNLNHFYIEVLQDLKNQLKQL